MVSGYISGSIFTKIDPAQVGQSYLLKMMEICEIYGKNCQYLPSNIRRTRGGSENLFGYCESSASPKTLFYYVKCLLGKASPPKTFCGVSKSQNLLKIAQL
jgi:hypothetical protein